MNVNFLHLVSALALTSATTLLLGSFILFKKKNQIGRVFFLYCLSISWWSFFQILHMTAPSREVALLWARIMEVGAFFIPTLFVHFVVLFLDSKKPKWFLPTGYVLSIIIAGLCMTPLMIDGAEPKYYIKYLMTPGPLYHYALIYFMACTIYGNYKLYETYRSATGVNKNQLAYLLCSSALGYIGGSANFLLVFNISISPLNPYGTYAVPLYVAATTYAIIRYRLMDITVAINKGLAYALLLIVIFIPTYLAVLISHRATFYSIPPLLAATLIFACGLWVVLKNYRSATNLTFGLLCLGVCTWLFSSFMSYSTSHYDEALFWEKVIYVGVVYIPAFFYQFCVNFLQDQPNKKAILINYLIGTIFLLLIPTHYFLDGLHSYYWGFYAKAGLLHPIFLAYFTSASALSLRKLYMGYKAKEESAPLEAVRIKYVFMAFVIGFAGSIDFIQLYGAEFYPIGFLFVTLWTMLVTYAVLKYQLMDISLILTPTTIRPYAPVLTLIPLYIGILLLIRAFTGSMQYVLTGILVVTFTILAGLLANLRALMEKAVEKILFRKKYDAYETLTVFSKSLITILDLGSLTREIVRTLVNVIGVKTASLYLLDKDKNTYVLSASHGLNADGAKTLSLAAVDELPLHLASRQSILVREELEYTPSAESLQTIVMTLSAIGTEICIPLVNKDRLIGFCNLGPRSNGQMYSEDDLSLLTALGQNAAIALDNAMLYEDLKRSQTLVQRTDRLRSLETIAGGFAHEIRNPLTSIKTFVQLAPERKDDSEFIDQFSKIVSEDVDRIERLIREILDYARYMEPRFMEEDLNDVVSSCLYFVEVKAGGKSITIERHLARGLPSIRLDRQQIKQVLLNLLLNAMDAMGDSGGTLTVRTHRLIKQGRDTWVQIEVADTGSGIPADNLEHIFDPFYTTKHESGEREGTGLGLSIAHQIVQEHRGDIEVESMVGSGTTFFVNLPVNPALGESPKEQQGHEKANFIGR